MPERYAPAFACKTELLYNNSGAAISQGCAVDWFVATTATTLENPDPFLSGGQREQLASQATRTAGIGENIQGIKLSVGSLYNHPVGVALQTIANTSWGLVGTHGPMDVRIGPSQTISVGDYLVVNPSSGTFIEDATSVTATTVIHALALEATITSGTCAAAYIRALYTGPEYGAVGKRT